MVGRVGGGGLVANFGGIGSRRVPVGCTASPADDDGGGEHGNEREDREDAEGDEQLEEVAHAHARVVAPVVGRARHRRGLAHCAQQQAETDPPKDRQHRIDHNDVDRRQAAARDEDCRYEDVEQRC